MRRDLFYVTILIILLVISLFYRSPVLGEEKDKISFLKSGTGFGGQISTQSEDWASIIKDCADWYEKKGNRVKIYAVSLQKNNIACYAEGEVDQVTYSNGVATVSGTLKQYFNDRRQADNPFSPTATDLLGIQIKSDGNARLILKSWNNTEINLLNTGHNAGLLYGLTDTSPIQSHYLIRLSKLSSKREGTGETTPKDAGKPDPSAPAEQVEVPGRGGVKSPQILYKAKPGYTDEARRANIQGVVVLSAIFRKDGTITDIKVVRGLGYGLDEEAIKAAQLIKFVPGQKDGQPVNVRARLEFTYDLLIEFAINVEPSTIVAKRGEKGEFTLKLFRLRDFKGNVSITQPDQERLKMLGIELEIPPVLSDEKTKCRFKIGDTVSAGEQKITLIGRSESGETQSATLNLVIQ